MLVPVFLPHLSGLLLFLMLLATGRASFDARSPQETDNDNSASLRFGNPTPSLAPTQTAGQGVPIPSTIVHFAAVQNATVCGSDDISWFYSGDESYTLSVAVTSTLSSGNYDATLLQTYDGGLGDGGAFSWSPIVVPAGTYIITASIKVINASFSSDPFYIFEGSNSSCLTPSSSSAALPPASSSPSSTSSSTSVPSGGATGNPVIGAATGGSSMSRGDIAGVVIGVVAFVLGLGATIVLFRRYRKRSATGPSRHSFFEKGPPKGAIAIGSRGNSFSSAHDGTPRALGGNYTGDPNSSSGFLPHIALGSSSFGEGTSLFTQGGEKRAAHALPTPPGAVAMSRAIRRMPHAYRDSTGSAVSGATAMSSPDALENGNRPSRHSSVLYTTDPFSTQPSTPSPRASGEYYNVYGGQSQVPVALFSPPSHTSSPRSFGSPGVPRDISVVSSASSSPDLTHGIDTVVPPVAVAEPVNSRRAPPAPPSVGKQAKRTRSARKPAPVYAPSVSGEALELVEPVTPHSTASSNTNASPYYRSSTGQQSRASLAPSSAGNDWSSAAAHSHSSASGASLEGSRLHLPLLSPSMSASISAHSPSTLVGHPPSFGGYGDLPELNHKSSFGDRQLHYLIPDPPPAEMR
ncbi:hypothetical protein M0805_002798 [Coniferiporia weirii]|nr:hypothetical protein M0805_002798 [Coniferiporia weirii]